MIVTGRVQGVGFRNFVRGRAQRLGVKGIVRNKKDGTVEIFIECRDVEQARQFTNAIADKGLSSNAAVSGVDFFEEGDPKYRKPWKEYGESFIIDNTKNE